MDPSPQASTGAELMRRLQGGEVEAFRALVETYQHRLINFCFRLLGNRAEAEEIGQEVLLRVYRQARRYRTDRPFEPWVYRIATNLCLNALRSRKRHPTVSLEAPQGASEDAPSLAEVLPTQDPSPAQTAASRERLAYLQQAISELPPRQRVALALREYQGFSYEQIAQTLGTSRKGVETLLYRAKETLRGRLRRLLA